jgi:acyl-CoA thioesterase I
MSLERFHRRVDAFDWRGGGTGVLIVVFGDSVTAGVAEREVLLHEDVYHSRLKRSLQRWRPRCLFNVLNSGISGDTTTRALLRLSRDVIAHQPDLVLVAFGLNDAVSGGRTNIENYRNELQQIVSRVQSETTADIILLTPPFLADRDNVAVHPVDRQNLEVVFRTQTDGTLAAYAEVVREVSRESGVGLADVHAAWQRLTDQGVDTTKLLANGLNHPTAEAHEIAAEVLMRCIAK